MFQCEHLCYSAEAEMIISLLLAFLIHIPDSHASSDDSAFRCRSEIFSVLLIFPQYIKFLQV